MQDRTTIGISDLLRQFIEALVEEVVLEGKPFDDQKKKWLQRYSEEEGLDYATLEKNLTEFIEVMEEWKQHGLKSSERLAKMLAQDCYISNDALDKLVSEISKVNSLDVDEDGNVFCTDKKIQGKLSIPSTMKGKTVCGIKEKAFKNCKSLTDIIIPVSVTEIGYDAFAGCAGLTSIVIPNSVTKIRGGAFQGCSVLTSIVLPGSVTEIGCWAFKGCNGLTSIVIPNSVKKIGSYAFFGCKGLKNAVIPNSVTEIGNSAFEECTGLTSIVIPNSVMEIGLSVFEECTGLTSIVIPNSVMEIGNWAFSNCTGLKSAKLPKRFKGRMMFPNHTEVEYY